MGRKLVYGRAESLRLPVSPSLRLSVSPSLPPSFLPSVSPVPLSLFARVTYAANILGESCLEI